MVGVMSSAVPTMTTMIISTIISSVWLPMKGRARSTIWPEISATVISQDDTSAAATRNITTAVICAELIRSAGSCDGFSSR